MIHEKNGRVSLCVQELCPPQDSLRTLAAIPACRNVTGLSVLSRGLRFGFLVGLVNSSSSGIREEHGSPRACLSNCLLDTVTG